MADNRPAFLEMSFLLLFFTRFSSFFFGGIKNHANKAYITDGLSSATVKTVFENAGVKHQTFFNRSDVRSGSTLGAAALRHTGMLGADIGLAQLAMHSSYETAGCMDVDYLVSAMTEFYSSTLCVASDGNCSLENNKKVREDYV